MDQTPDLPEEQPVAEAAEAPEAPATPAEPAPPITSRFLFVDVAALRAKQLRRGARVRLADEIPLPRKPERVAMEEVRHGLVYYDVPEPTKPDAPAEGAE